MPMAIWPHKELNSYVCLIPAHEHDEDSLKEIEIERQKPQEATTESTGTTQKEVVKPPKK